MKAGGYYRDCSGRKIGAQLEFRSLWECSFLIKYNSCCISFMIIYAFLLSLTKLVSYSRISEVQQRIYHALINSSEVQVNTTAWIIPEQVTNLSDLYENQEYMCGLFELILRTWVNSTRKFDLEWLLDNK